MLKEFRSIDVYWDKATRRIYEEIRSSSSDEKGRKLTVQIVNDGQIQDLTNVALNLYWETQDGENRGLDPFEPLDAENGIYELYFRTGMLQHVGKLNAHLHLVDTTGAITSEPFTIVVFQGVDVDAMASEDELSALNQALIEVQNIKQDEAERVANEDLRAGAETERIAAEEERVSNENERKTAETTRNTNETTRVSNETDRVNAEQARATAETERVTAESARVSAEEERAEGYPLLDGRLTTVEENLNLVKVEKTSYGTGSSPVVQVQLSIPDGCTHEGVIYQYTSSSVLINYHAAYSTPYFILNFYSYNGTDVPADRHVKVTAWFRKIII